MPDLQTEIFTKVLPSLNNLKFDDPDQPEEPTMTTTAIPLTRQVFEYIKTNPKSRGKVVLDFFQAAGFKRPVIAATVTALIKSQRLVRQGGKLSVLQQNYEMPKVVKVAKVTDKKPKPAKITTPTYVDTAKMLEGLTIMQGRELYDRLKAIYGG
jgi:hypothetical protein